MGLKAEVDILYNAIVNGPSVQLTRYPANAAAAALTASGMTTGAYKYAAAGANQVQVVAAGTNTTGMWVCGASLRNPSAASIFVLWIGRGTVPAATRLAELDFEDTQFVFGGAAAGSVTIDLLLPRDGFLPMAIFVRAGVGIALDLASSNAGADDTANGTVIVMTGLGS
jgi:hypothetical protein